MKLFVTVGQLLEKLEGLPKDMSVYLKVSGPYADALENSPNICIDRCANTATLLLQEEK